MADLKVSAQSALRHVQRLRNAQADGVTTASTCLAHWHNSVPRIRTRCAALVGQFHFGDFAHFPLGANRRRSCWRLAPCRPASSTSPVAAD